MKHLLEGYRRFRAEVFPEKRGLYAMLARGQRPSALFITCSDSRVDPHEFTQSEAGDLFIERSIGNLVPRHGRGEHEAIAAVEYAAVALEVEHIIVCGHSHCGAMKALLDPEALRAMPLVAAWLQNAEETRQAVRRKFGHLDGEDLLRAATRENVLVQLDHLALLPVVASKVAEGRLQVHGWVYDFEHGIVEVFNARAEKFIPLSEAIEVETAGEGTS